MTSLTRADVEAVLGPIEDSLAADILKVGADRDELLEAYAWVSNDEAMMNAGRPLASGRVGQLIEILEAADEIDAADDIP
jgi:hypothetical protein